jgi:hypothetical protein
VTYIPYINLLGSGSNNLQENIHHGNTRLGPAMAEQAPANENRQSLAGTRRIIITF